jgi:peptidoglycan/LPS O-acetylase OafA/YrhL
VINAPAKRYQDIQVLRAVACAMAIFYHLSLTRTLFTHLPGAPSIPLYLGVEVFFVISGYVVTHALFSREVNPVAFLIRRFFRLTPAILTFLMFSLIVFTLIAALPPQESSRALRLIGAADFLRQSAAILSGVLINYADGTLYYFGAMWSLSVEYQFYAAYAAITLVLLAAGLAKPQMKDTILGTAVCLILLCQCIRFGVFAHFPLNYFDPALLSYIANWRFDFLLYGVLLALFTDRFGPLHLPRRTITIVSGTALMAITLAVGMVSESELDAIKPVYHHVLMPVSGICFTLLVALASGRSSEITGQHAIFRAMVWLGDRSYSMYLFHFPVMALFWWSVVVFIPSLFYVHPIWFGLVQAGFTFLVTILAADVTYRFVELPWNAVGARLSDRTISLSWRSPPAPPPASSVGTRDYRHL